MILHHHELSCLGENVDILPPLSSLWPVDLSQIAIDMEFGLDP